MDFSSWKRKIAVFKFTLGRGYLFCQLPALSLIGAGVLAPYFPGLGLWLLAIISFTIMMFVGWLDVKFHILHEEQKYMTEKNPMLMEGLFGGNLTKTASIVTPEKDMITAQQILDEINIQEENG